MVVPQGVVAKNAFELAQRRQRRLNVLIDAADSGVVGAVKLANSHQVIQQFFACHALAAQKQTVINLLLHSHIWLFTMDAQVVQLVEHHEFFIHQRLFRQGALVGQIGAAAHHALDEVLRRLLHIDFLRKVPRIDAAVFLAREALRPHIAAFFAAVLLPQRAHIVRNLEAVQLQNAF